nr:MAG TPA: hypothetical protein [Caudoviricetes sp.]
MTPIISPMRSKYMRNEEKIRTKLNLALKQIKMLENMNKDMFKENHEANLRVMQLEEENAYLRQLSCGCD